MLKPCLIIFILFSLASCIDPITHRKNPDLIQWKGMQEADAYQALVKRIPLQTSADSVTLFLKKQKLFPIITTPVKSGSFITTSTRIMREKIMIKSKWLFKFHFDTRRKLSKIDIRKSLIKFWPIGF